MPTPRYVTAANVKIASGLKTGKFISDEDMNELCYYAEYEVEKILNTSFTPRTIIEQHNGTDSERLMLLNNPVLKVRAITIDTTSVTPKYTRLDKQAGILWLSSSAEVGTFQSKSTERNLVRVKYDYGTLEPDTYQTTLSAAATAGTAVTLTVTSSSGFTAGKYIEIQGMDSMQETVLISSIPGSTSIIVDNLAYNHENGSLVTQQKIPQIVERMMIVFCALSAVSRVVGQSFDENTGYSLGKMQVQKGEPYTQWRETATQLKREWDVLLNTYRIRPSIM